MKQEKSESKCNLSNLNTKMEDYLNNDLKNKNFIKIIKDVENENLDVNNAVKLIFNNIKH